MNTQLDTDTFILAVAEVEGGEACGRLVTKPKPDVFHAPLAHMTGHQTGVQDLTLRQTGSL